MADRSWQFPSLSRDLAIVGTAFLAVAALVGAGIGVAVDVAIHRHRAGVK